jgi:hypothetical protein
MMNWKVKSAIGLAGIGLLIGGSVFWTRSHSRPAVQVVARLSVQPPDQLDLVMTKASSARFKYVLGKISSTKPYLAQRLELKRLPKSAQIEARIGLENREEAEKFLQAFAAALQDFCGSQVRLSLEGQTIR